MSARHDDMFPVTEQPDFLRAVQSGLSIVTDADDVNNPINY